MRNKIIARVNLIVILLSLLPFGRIGSADEPIVRALLFYSPSCPHCHIVITEGLPPIIDQYGDQILILAVNTYTEKGNELFQAAVNHYNIPNEHIGVPLMVVGENILIGSYEIPQMLPEIIAQGLVSGGIDWPEIPGLAQLLENETLAGSNEKDPNEGMVGDNLDADMEEQIGDFNESVKTMFVFVDGLTKNIGKCVSILFDNYGLDINYIGGGSGSLSFEQKPSLFTKIILSCTNGARNF